MRIVDITVPTWGLEMEEATVIEWLKQVGDTIREGEPIVTIETDKASGEVEAEASGRLMEILVEPGTAVEPGNVLGRMEIDA